MLELMVAKDLLIAHQFIGNLKELMTSVFYFSQLSMKRKYNSEIRIFFGGLLLILSNAVFSQNCSDTTIKERYYLNSDTSIAAYKTIPQKSGNYFLLTKSWSGASTLFNTILSKKDPYGNILWSQRFGVADSSLILSQVLELNDQSILALGTVQSKQTPFKVAQDPILLHLTQAGIVIQSWRINLKETDLITGFSHAFLCQIDSNAVTLLINYSSEQTTSTSEVMRWNIQTGQCTWASKFYKNQFFYTNGMMATSDGLFIINNFSENIGPMNEKQGINLMKLNPLTGSILLNKSYKNSFNNILPSAANVASVRQLADGSYKVVFVTSKDNEANKIIILCFDSNLDITMINCIGNISDNYIIRNFSINHKGAFAFSFFNYLNTNEHGYIVVDSSNQLLEQKKLLLSSGISYSVAFSDFDLYLDDYNKLSLYTSVNSGPKIETEAILKNIYNTDSTCVGFNFNEASTESFSLQPALWSVDQENTILPDFNVYSIIRNSLAVRNLQVCMSRKLYTSGLSDTVVKCNDDSVILRANANYLQYSWQPNNFSIPINDSTLKVFPPVSYEYFFSAKTYRGCLIKDTVRITVNRSADILFPNDTSICFGDSIMLDAGSSFISYLWNDGTANRYKTITDTGDYSIEAKDGNQCVSKDSFRLIGLHPTPSVNIQQNQILCRGQTDRLFGGIHTSYVWQDGSTSSVFLVQETGLYWVKVKNTFGCEGSDSVRILQIAEYPVNFINSDTSICFFESIYLKPIYQYASYLWSDGNTTPFISVNRSGIYSLQVTDSNGCKGEEQVTVSEKDCPNVLIFPTAFTPNGDGKNDVFKPVVKGFFDLYELSIFNRWGQRVFYTIDPLKGWNGKLESTQQSAVFVWVCNFQFKNQKPVTKRGTTMLVR